MGFFDKFKNSMKSQEDLDLELYSMCGWKGNYSKIVQKLDAGANPNNIKWGVSLVQAIGLLVASENKPEAIATIKLLLARGANVNLQDKVFGRTALMEACREGDPDTVELLLNNGANNGVNLSDQRGHTALLYALGAASKNWGFSFFTYDPSERRRVVELLLKSGADPDVQDWSGKKAVDWAPDVGTSVASLLAKSGATSPLVDFDDNVLGLALDMLRVKLGKLGESLDKSFEVYYGAEDRKQREVNTAFLLLSSSLLGTMACVDGFPSKQELSLFGTLTEALQLSYGQKNAVEKLFKCPVMEPSLAGDLTNTFRIELDAFYKVFGHNPIMVDTLAAFLFDMGYADGSPLAAEQQLLDVVMATLRLNRSDYDFYSGNEPPLYQQASSIDVYYSVLRSKPSDSDEYIKQQYRKLAKDYHPDVIQGKGLPEDFIKFANSKFKEIQEAYEGIMKSRQG